MKAIATRKAQVKPTSRGVRIWLEGGFPAKAGFNRYQPYTREITNGRIVMKLDPDGELKVAGRVRGGKDLPIIDISAVSIEGFTAGQDLEVHYSEGQIVIEGAKYTTQPLTVEEERVIYKAKEILYSRMCQSEAMTDPHATRTYLQLELADEPNELFGCLFLDNQNRVIQFEVLFRGTIDACSVHPRVVMQRVLELNASAVIFAHNHPASTAEPSQADIRITDVLKKCLVMIDVRVLDHMIVTRSEIESMAERGLV